jgi:hypothetical protein
MIYLLSRSVEDLLVDDLLAVLDLCEDLLVDDLLAVLDLYEGLLVDVFLAVQICVRVCL